MTLQINLIAIPIYRDHPHTWQLWTSVARITHCFHSSSCVIQSNRAVTNYAMSNNWCKTSNLPNSWPNSVCTHTPIDPARHFNQLLTTSRCCAKRQRWESWRRLPLKRLPSPRNQPPVRRTAAWCAGPASCPSTAACARQSECPNARKRSQP